MLDRVKAAEQELRNARAELQEVSRATSAMPGAWNLTQEQKLKLEDIFEGLKEDALEKRATLINEVNMEFGLRAEEICARAATYTEYKDFESEFVREWEVSRKVQALAGLNFVRAVAECVPGGSPGAPLEDIAGFDSEELTSFCGWRVAETSADLLKTHFEKESRAPMDMLALLENCENNWDAKFAQHEAVLTQVHYGKMADFNAGLLAKIGLPDHRLWEAMEREHCTRPDSKDPFESKNYVLKTTPEAEWIAVTNEEVGKAVSGGLRRVKSIADLRKHSRAEEAGLLDQEILALVLYTGPMYEKYNKVLRDPLPTDGTANTYNTYTTTIHLIVSGVIKLARKMKVPANRVVFRGLSNIKLPAAFLEADACGIRGGVEYGLMSTTLDRNVATKYAGKGEQGDVPTVFAIQVGAVNRGASLDFLSQYEQEQEILFPPCSFLEVLGETRIETGAGKATTRVVVLSVNANQTCGTIEDMLGSRRRLHLAMLENYKLEIEGRLEALLEGEVVQQRLARDGYAKKYDHHEGMKTAVLDEVNALVLKHTERKAKWYNEDGQYESAMAEAMQLEKRALGKLLHWASGSAYKKTLEKEPMHLVRWRALGQLFQRVRAAQERGEERVAQDTAMELCKELGLVGNSLMVKSVDERNEEEEKLPLVPAAAAANKWAGRSEGEEPPLVRAAAGGNVWALQLLLAAGCRVNSSSFTGWTALHSASALGNLESVALLLQEGADIHAKTTCAEGKEGKETCLTLAADAGHTDVVRCLVAKGGARLLMDPNSDQRSCAFLASRHGHVETLQVLLAAGGAALLMTPDKYCNSCAYQASKNGHVEVLKVLLQMRLEVLRAGGGDLLEIKNEWGHSCAFMASQYGHVEALEELLQAAEGDELMSVALDGRSCAYIASANGHVGVLKLLLQRGGRELLKLSKKGVSCVWIASARGHVEVLEVLLNAEGGRELLMEAKRNKRSCSKVALQNKHLEAGAMLELAEREGTGARVP